jgi:hypothetical protein
MSGNGGLSIPVLDTLVKQLGLENKRREAK